MKLLYLNIFYSLIQTLNISLSTNKSDLCIWCNLNLKLIKKVASLLAFSLPFSYTSKILMQVRREVPLSLRENPEEAKSPGV